MKLTNVVVNWTKRVVIVSAEHLPTPILPFPSPKAFTIAVFVVALIQLPIRKSLQNSSSRFSSIEHFLLLHLLALQQTNAVVKLLSFKIPWNNRKKRNCKKKKMKISTLEMNGKFPLIFFQLHSRAINKMFKEEWQRERERSSSTPRWKSLFSPVKNCYFTLRSSAFACPHSTRQKSLPRAHLLLTFN